LTTLAPVSLVHGDGLDRAGMQAPGLVALGAGVRHLLAGMVEVKNLDARLGGGVGAVILERTGHFALHAAGAFVCVDVQDFLHVGLLWGVAPVAPCL
jgi:hypothetical protein